MIFSVGLSCLKAIRSIVIIMFITLRYMLLYEKFIHALKISVWKAIHMFALPYEKRVFLDKIDVTS